jgi:tetraacyldisaccharide 4'-kinase
VLSRLYRALARRRRTRLVTGGRQKRLARPVISVGNLAVGGRGKTPLVATVTLLLLEAGERPAILSRGHGRTEPSDTPVVVSDGHDLLADLARNGIRSANHRRQRNARERRLRHRLGRLGHGRV